MNHTPGPWAKLIYSVHAQTKPGIYGIQVAETSFEDNDMSHEECEANARLIAAAPELLEALIKIHNMLVDIGPINETASRMLGITYPAIKKAEGI